MTNGPNNLADEMLKDVLNWLYGANDEVAQWENVREDARNDASGKNGDDEEERKLRQRKADAELRMADVGRTASREIQHAALAELGELQGKVFVRRVDVSEPSKGLAIATADLRKGMEIPEDYRFYWKAGDAKVTPIDDQWLSVEIDADALPAGDTTVKAILGKKSGPPVRGM